jgi:hypothetical protein
MCAMENLSGAPEQLNCRGASGLSSRASSRRPRSPIIWESLESRQYLSAAAGLNLLFFGNSYTNNTTDGSAYDMPATLKSIATADGFSAPNVYEQILLGQTLADHLNKIAADGGGNIINSLPAGQNWNDVILQEYSTRPTNAAALEGNVPLFESDALQLFNDVRANSPSVHGVLYETWARGSLNSYYPTYFSGPADMQNQLQTNYNLAVGNINSADGLGSVTVSPAGEAWRGLNWQANLYSTISGDGVQYHPSTEGILLNAMVNFDTIYHAQVSGVPLANVGGILSSLGLTNATWTTLAAAADTAVQANAPVPGDGSLVASQATAASQYNLTTLGPSDWAHWGRGAVYGNFDHSASGGSQISNVTTINPGGAGFGGYLDNSRSVNWTSGTPTSSSTGDNGYIWANNAIGAGYSFTVPASTKTQTLDVYAGGYSSGGTLRAHLSDNSAADYVATASGNGIYSKLYTITYQASSPAQTLTITYTKTQNINGTGGSVDLIAAALGAAVGTDTTAPAVTAATLPSITSASTSAYTFAVTYTDNVAINAATLGNNNLLVTGPGYSKVATLVSSGLINGPTIVATYSVPAPAAGWTTSSNGSYTVALQSNQVADTSGNFAPANSFANFTVSLPFVGGTLIGTQNSGAASYNLTTLGTSDWAHWGTGNVVSAFTHKASGGSQISNVTRLGSGNYGSYFDASRDVIWSDGTPQASNPGDHAYLWASNAIGAGYSFTVPASTITHTLYVYAGGYSSGATLTAHLSDGSAADYVATASGSGLYTNLYAITFTAASASKTLTFSYVKSSNINGTGGSVDLIAAALV